MQTFKQFVLCFLFASMVVFTADAADDFYTTEEILQNSPDETQCATAVFSNALAADSVSVSEDDSFTTMTNKPFKCGFIKHSQSQMF